MYSELVAAGEAVLGFPLDKQERQLVKSLAENRECELAPEVEVRAEALEWVLTIEKTSVSTTEPPLRITGGCVVGSVHLPARSIARSVRFRGTRFRGDLVMRASTMRSLQFLGCSIKTLDLNGSWIEGDLALEGHGSRRTQLGRLTLATARVAGHVIVHQTDAGCVDLEDARLAGSLSLGQQARVRGGLRARRLRVGGDAHLVDASFRGSGAAVDMSRAHVEGALFIHPELESWGRMYVDGSVVLDHAYVGSDLALPRLSVASTSVYGVSARSARVGGGIWLSDSSVSGGVDLAYAQVAGNIELNSLHLHPRRDDSPDSEVSAESQPWTDEVPAIDLGHLSAGGSLLWDVYLPDRASVSLQGVSVGEFHYTSDLDWTERADLSGFTYRWIESQYSPLRRPKLAAAAKKTLRWRINDRPGGRVEGTIHDYVFEPDNSHLNLLRSHAGGEIDLASYHNLAKVHLDHGRQRDAETVAMAATNDRNRAAGVPRVILGLPFRAFTGNGYRPVRALWWALGFILVGAVLYNSQFNWTNFATESSGWDERAMQPVIYSADILLPIVDFGEASRYQLTDSAPGWLRWFQWFQIAAGWLIAATLGATIARLAREPS